VRIFCAVRHSAEPRFYYGGLWSGNFYPALRQLGHEVVESNVDLLPASRFMDVAKDFTPEELDVRGKVTEQILDEVGVAHGTQPIDLFLSYFYNAHFDPAGFAELRRLGIPSVNFYCNSIYQFDLVRAVAAEADFSWHAEKNARPFYLAAGANPIWVQMAADPAVYGPLNRRRERVLSFIGQRYADRDRYAAALVRAGLPLVLYGPNWTDSAAEPTEKAEVQTRQSRVVPRVGTAASYVASVRSNWRREGLVRGSLRSVQQVRHRTESRKLVPLLAPFARGPVPFDQQKEIFAGSEVVLNFSNVWADGRPCSKLIPHVRLRDFEAPMCRTCYLTGYTDEITEFYELGKEIDTYRCAAELVEKARFYLGHPEAAENLREAGYQRARRDHTWVRRFEELFTKIGMSRAG
jgi:hypothetical protein